MISTCYSFALLVLKLVVSFNCVTNAISSNWWYSWQPYGLFDVFGKIYYKSLDAVFVSIRERFAIELWRSGAASFCYIEKAICIKNNVHVCQWCDLAECDEFRMCISQSMAQFNYWICYVLCKFSLSWVWDLISMIYVTSMSLTAFNDSPFGLVTKSVSSGSARHVGRRIFAIFNGV